VLVDVTKVLHVVVHEVVEVVLQVVVTEEHIHVLVEVTNV
jgi:hypothetical protein